MKGHRTFIGFCFTLFLLLSTSAGIAQTITGAVRGTVTDSSGAVVVNAKVTATNVGTGVATSVTTNKDGSYNIEFLPIGEYKVTATSAGFAESSIRPFKLQIDQVAKIDIQLQVGNRTESISISAATAPILNAENATLGISLSSNTLQNMPMNGQNVNFASMFVPGTVNPTVGSMGDLQGSERDTRIGSSGQGAQAVPSFNGNRQQSNNYVLDGIEINETLNNLIGYYPSPYSIQEMRVITGNADAEYGNVDGGEVVLVTKSGTNQFHGNAWEYFENQNLTANTWFNNLKGVAKTRFTQNQYGAAVGGPILKNKLFFFGDYSGMYYTVPTSQGVASVPDARMRTGDFSEVLATEGIQFYNNSNGTGSATPYVNNQIPIVNPVAKYLFSNTKALPMPNNTAHVLPGTVTSGNYIGYTSSHNANNQGDARIDYTIDNKNSLVGKYTYGDAYDATTQNVLPTNFPLGDDYPFASAMVSWVRTFSPSLVNEFRGGYSQTTWHQGIPSDPSGLFGLNGDQTVGIPFLNQPVVGFSFMAISDCSSSNDWSCYGTTINADNYLNDITLDYSDNLTWQHGHHVTKFGAQLVRYHQNFLTLSNLGGPLGQFSYNGEYTAGPTGRYAYADFLLDSSNQEQVTGVTSAFAQRQWRDAFYAQDDWRMTPKLTLNLGVRWGYDQPIYEVHNRMSSIDLQAAYFAPALTESMFELAGKNGNSRALYNNVTAYDMFMPRVGFAWQLDNRLVLRGGYGITDDEEGTGTGLRMTQNAPWQASFSQSAPKPTSTSGGTPFQTENGFALIQGNGSLDINTILQSLQGSQFDVWDPNFRPAVVQQFNLTAQYLVNSTTSASVGYVGQIGQHLAVPMGLNQYTGLVPSTCATPGPNGGCAHLVDPYDSVVGPNGFIIDTMANGIENYNALQAVLQHQQSNGLEYALNYSYSKSMTDNPGFFGMNGSAQADPLPQNVFDLMGDYGPSGSDVKHNLSGTMVYELPFGRKRRFGTDWNRFTDEALGGWALSGAVILHSGFPITIQTFSPTGLTNSAQENDDGVERANQYRPMKIVHRSTQNWFGTDSSAVPCQGPDNGICAYGQPGGPTLADQFGNDRVGTERAPGYRQIDFSFFKAFRTRGDQNVKFRVDAFNAFNMASYGMPKYNVDSATFGRIINTLSPPRQFQFSAVYQF